MTTGRIQLIAGTLVFLCFAASGQRTVSVTTPKVIVLGTAQDGGFPQAGCTKSCCRKALKDSRKQQLVSSIAIADPESRRWWLFDATPDLPRQLELFAQVTGRNYPTLPDGIFITHAHMGHFSGLLQLGREVMNTSNVPVYVMPRMKQLLTTQAPWIQLSTAGNIRLTDIFSDVPVDLAPNICATAIPVPHRDEFSETAGFRLETSGKQYLFIPDIDKWEKWGRSILEEVQKVDEAFLDATFHSETELPNRNIREIPHPMVTETIALFSGQPMKERQKIRFIHINHTNPLLLNRELRSKIMHEGFGISRQGEIR